MVAREFGRGAKNSKPPVSPAAARSTEAATELKSPAVPNDKSGRLRKSKVSDEIAGRFPDDHRADGAER